MNDPADGQGGENLDDAGSEGDRATESPTAGPSDASDGPDAGTATDGRREDGGAAERSDGDEPEDLEALRRQVDEEYDFENFGPEDMAEMSAREWEAAFDPETWITGDELLDRVEADLKQRVADRDVFARIERRDDHLIAYSDSGYATVYPDGSVEGRGTVLRDVKPTVALCSMESYDVPEQPPDEQLPEPAAVPEGSGDFGNLMLQIVAGVQILAGVVLIAASLLITFQIVSLPGGGGGELNVAVMLFAGIAFAIVGIFLFAVVANARLSDKFRAEEYRNRLRAVELEPGEEPEFLPDAAEVREADDHGESNPQEPRESTSN